MANEFASVMQPLATYFFGEPNRALSSEFEWRYGSRGSLSIDLRKATFFDHETGEGGGVLALVSRETHLVGAERLDWLTAKGFLYETVGGNGGAAPRQSITATYDYCDADGVLLFQVCRFEPKDFRQRRPDGLGGWEWSVKGVQQVPYRLPDLLDAGDRVVFVVEGEKDADRLWRLGIPATCNAGGANKWRPELSEYFQGSDVVVLPDHDVAGQDHGAAVAAALTGIARRVRLLELWRDWPEMPVKGDVSDWLAHGGTAERLLALAADLPVYMPGVESEPAPPQPSLPFINFRNWDNEIVPEQEWVVRDRLPRRQTALFSGEGAIGKSMTLLYLCAACALGRDWLGTVPEMGPALFIDAEDEAQVIHRRLAAVTKHYQVRFEDLYNNRLHLMSLAGQDAVLAVSSRGGKITPTPLYEQLAQAIDDLKPVVIGMASSANFFAGNEINRSEVQQFIGLLTKLAISANGTVVLLSHPSLTGMSSGSGLSGNTAWHASVRARFYMRSVKADNDDEAEDESNLREIIFKKSNYGPLADTMVLEWRDGMFLPKHRASMLDQAADDAKVDTMFMSLLRRFNSEGRLVGHKKGPSYAPAQFAAAFEAKNAGINSRLLERAMERLFQAGMIYAAQYGRPSRPSFHIAIR